MRLAILTVFSAGSVLMYAQNLGDINQPPPGAPPHAAATPDRAAWEALHASLRDGNADHRRQALGALAMIDCQSMDCDGNGAAKAAAEALQDKDPLVRQSAALALGEMKATSAIPALKQALDDKGEVAFAAAKALAEMNDEDGRDFLIAVLSGERKDTVPGMMANAKREGKSYLKHPEGLVLMGAEDATGAMFGPASMVFPAVKDTMSLKSKGVPGRAAAAAFLAKDSDPYAITLLEWALDDDNEFVRLEAAKGLGQRGNSGSLAKLQNHLDDQHNEVRDVAAVAIIRIVGRGGNAGEPAEGPVSLAPAKKKPVL